MERMYRALELARLPGELAEGLEAQPAVEPPPAQRHAFVAPVDPARLRSRRIVLAEDAGAAASAYRMLRAQFLPRLRASQIRTVGVVSAADGEGKTLTTANLALSLAAEPNQTVLIVDLDLRHPSVASLLDLPATCGLEAWLGGACSLSGLFWRLQGIERLSILPTITPLAGSSEVLAGPRAKDLMQHLATRYADRIMLIDLPPVLLADDVLTIAPLLDAVILVAAEGRTRRDDLLRVRELLGPVHILGTVLNRASESERRAY